MALMRHDDACNSMSFVESCEVLRMETPLNLSFFYVSPTLNLSFFYVDYTLWKGRMKEERRMGREEGVGVKFQV